MMAKGNVAEMKQHYPATATHLSCGAENKVRLPFARAHEKSRPVCTGRLSRLPGIRQAYDWLSIHYLIN
jgi:hypothetical protein